MKPSCKNKRPDCNPKRLAMAYVPMQKICGFFEPMEGLCKGTIFPELSEPYK